jgi:beta-glucosidase/6-phospho-beta-glucosidase/beta-galactosidase
MIFNSFFMGGFECADHINRSGNRINLLRETEHDKRVQEDYQLLANVGIKTLREGLCWSNVEKTAYQHDFSEVKSRIEAAALFGIQQIWDLCHFGYPDGIYPTHPHFCDRFESLCRAFAEFYKTVTSQTLMVVPINEISFLSWHSGDVRGTVPFSCNSGFDIKYHLCKAAIKGIEALRAVTPECRIILVEPMIRVHPRDDTNESELFNLNEVQFQAMDIIAGRMCAELGGNEANLDILGFNYYWDCQWQIHGRPLPWPEMDQECTGPFQSAGTVEGEIISLRREFLRWGDVTVAASRNVSLREPLRCLLETVYSRYERPIFLAETGHFGTGRSRWLEEVTTECIAAMDAGVELLGICIYPVIDRPDWDDLSRFHNSGIWDLDNNRNRVVVPEYIDTLLTCIARSEPRSLPASQSYLVQAGKRVTAAA